MSDGPRIACAHRSVVGESPVWDGRSGCLHWVDILGKCILTLAPGEAAPRVTRTPDFPTAIGLCRDPAWAIVAFAGGVAMWRIGSDAFEPFAQLPDDPPGNRLNEGAVAPDGSFWLGTMQSNFDDAGRMRAMDRASGAFYRIAPDGAVRRMTAHRFGITNTLAWDTAGGRMIFGDTLAQTLYHAPWPLTDPGALPVVPLATIRAHGHPDGSCLDEEGYLWNARYGGGCLLRLAPDGRIDRRVELPATNATACTFGGAGHRTLYVTTATNQLGAPALQNPAEGALLALTPGVAGTPAHHFGA